MGIETLIDKKTYDFSDKSKSFVLNELANLDITPYELMISPIYKTRSIRYYEALTYARRTGSYGPDPLPSEIRDAVKENPELSKYTTHLKSA